MKNKPFYTLLLVLIFPLPGFCQSWIPASETNFDFSSIRRIESGPPGHVYALDSKLRLGLIRFDTIGSGTKFKIEASLVKSLPLALWPGFENELRQFDFSSVSEDGRQLALSLTSRKILSRNNDGSPVLAAPREELFLLDFASDKLDFRAETFKKPVSAFFGETIRFTQSGETGLLLMAKDAQEEKKRVLLQPEGNTPAGTQFLGRHISLGNQGFTSEDKVEIRDMLNRISLTLTVNQILLSKDGQDRRKIEIPGNTDLELFRFRETMLLIIQPMDSFLLLNPRNGEIQQIPRPEGKIHQQSGLLNGHILASFSKGCFSLCDLRSGKVQKTLPVKTLSGNVSEIPQLANAGADRIIRWNKAGKQFRFNLRSRQFQMEKISGADSQSLRFPVLNSKKFRIRATRFTEIEDSSKTAASAFSPGIYLNGIRIGSYYGTSIQDFLKLDINDKSGMAFLHYHQPLLIALNPAVKKIWSASNPSPLLGLKADEEGQSLFTISENGVVDFRNAKNGIKYLSLAFDSSGKDWILWTPSGYFDSSPGAESLLSWMPGGEESCFPGLFPVSGFSKEFRKPELVDATMLCRDEKEALRRLKASSGLQAQRKRMQSLPAEIQLEFPGDRFSFTGTEIKIPYFLVPGRLPLKKIQLFVDGKALPDYLPDGRETLSISLPAKNCLLELVPVSAAGEGRKIQSRLYWQAPR